MVDMIVEDIIMVLEVTIMEVTDTITELKVAKMINPTTTVKKVITDTKVIIMELEVAVVITTEQKVIHTTTKTTSLQSK